MAIALGSFSDGAARRRSAGQRSPSDRGHLRAAGRPGDSLPYSAPPAPVVAEAGGGGGSPALEPVPGAAAGADPEPGGEEPASTAGPIDSRLLKKSFTQLEPHFDRAMAYFYGSLFVRNPEFRAMFPLAMDGQRRRLADGLARAVWGAGQQQALTDYLRDLARDHRKFGVADKHYQPFCAGLLASLQSFGGGAWTAETEAAWRALLEHMAGVMADATREAAGEPAWWLGEVVRHERRGPDVAVLTLRAEAEQPLRHQAGQYLSVQVSRWPRAWRCYSVANAPRPDGTLDLHVRAVPGGRVSSLLVGQTQPGDTLLLGPARGAMTVAAAPGTGDILCVAGGTGLAPLKALAEELADSPRTVRLLAGARHRGDLYDLPDLRRLEESSTSLTVVPVIAPAGRPAAAREALPAAVAAQLTPDTSDIFVSGPDAMVRAVTRQLAGLAPGVRIHADSLRPWRPGRRQADDRDAGEPGQPAAAAGTGGGEFPDRAAAPGRGCPYAGQVS
jgi:NAD(P)H-flavin reductase/hemoglobin-like flavoprotein